MCDIICFAFKSRYKNFQAVSQKEREDLSVQFFTFQALKMLLSSRL